MPDIRVELFHSDVWNDVTADCLARDDLQISHGRADESPIADPSKCTLLLNNRAGTYSPRNPASPLFGLIGRNTPLRVSLPDDGHVLFPGTIGQGLTTPDHAALAITGDIDIRAELDLTDAWRTGFSRIIAGKLTDGTNQGSWVFWITDDGTLDFDWSTDGISFPWATSTVQVPEGSGRVAVRVTLDVDNGAAGHTATFYTGPTIDGPWTPLGAPVTGAGVTSIFAGTDPLEVGTNAADFADQRIGAKLYAFRVYNSAGVLVADADLRELPPGTTSFTDGPGRLWTVTAPAAVDDRVIRFVGEVTSWPSRWEASGRDVWVPIEAAGVRRRMGQGVAPLRSTMYRALSVEGPGTEQTVAYWPMEEGAAASMFAAGIAGFPPMNIEGGEVSFGDYGGFDCSEPLPAFGAAEPGDRVRVAGQVAPISSFFGDPRITTTFLLHVPSDGVPGVGHRLMTFSHLGTGRLWAIDVYATGNLGVQLLDRESVSVFNTGELPQFDVNGKKLLVIFALRTPFSGPDTEWELHTIQADAGFATQTASGTVAGFATRAPTMIQVGPTTDLGGTSVGHIRMQINQMPPVFLETTLIAFAGFTAGDQLERLSDQEDVPIAFIGGTHDTVLLGPQRALPMLELFDEAALADLGLFGDARDFVGFVYRSRTSMYNQAPAVELDYAAGHIAPPLEPEDDDQRTRNDVTVTRTDGGSSRAIETTGQLSTAPPPAGVGIYDEQLTLNLFRDTQTANQAAWRVHVGTVDEARYPTVRLDLTAPALAPLVSRILALRLGDRVTIANPPAWLPPEMIDLIVFGYSETINTHTHQMILNCGPASVFTVGVVGDADARVDTDGSETTAPFTAGTDTALTVASTAGPVWTTDPAEFPLRVRAGGVVLNVTAVSGATSPQTFTVDQAPVNGVTRIIPAGTDIRLDSPTIIGL